MLSLMRTMMSQGEQLMDLVVLRGSVLTVQRNALIQRMRGDWILFIDDDMQWDPGAVHALLQTKQELEGAGIFPDILGGLCVRRAPPHQPTLYTKTDHGYALIEDWGEDGVQEVDATGMAFALVTRDCIERLTGGPMPPFEDRIAEPNVPDFFKWYGQLGEDLRFCQDVREAGERIMVDTRVRTRHIGEKAFGYDDYLREFATRTADELDKRKAINDAAGLPTLMPSSAMEKLRDE